MKNELAQFTGTDHYYRHLKGVILTDGTKYLAEEAGAYWLMDLIASYQPMLNRHADYRLHQMQFWTLKVNPNKSAVATCIADSGEPPAVEQHIPLTDFPIEEIKIWVIQQEAEMVIILPSEY